MVPLANLAKGLLPTVLRPPWEITNVTEVLVLLGHNSGPMDSLSFPTTTYPGFIVATRLNEL